MPVHHSSNAPLRSSRIAADAGTAPTFFAGLSFGKVGVWRRLDGGDVGAGFYAGFVPAGTGFLSPRGQGFFPLLAQTFCPRGDTAFCPSGDKVIWVVDLEN
ncbi:hypothetical protein GCM10010873_14920 [Cypionkella aquatica]|uniref:Uncharacterized protein n=1 Tax=Cypionkella aquatica TaxID=1756042 RepID=A0AA37TSD1_9RHOB|nr:hypothetical protein GCM10010873_14920 [Cypionkella aquatica]